MPTPTLTVMTRNLYIGADITRPLEAVSGLEGDAALLALGHATHAVRQTLAATDFTVRARLLAAEIAGARPDVIGMQEVALWRRGPLQFDQRGIPNATEVVADYLALLLAELTAHHAPYDVAGVLQGADVEAASFTGSPATCDIDHACNLRLTMRDVVLVRRDADLSIVDSGGARFAAQLEVPVAAHGTTFGHGYVWADLVRDGHSWRFITTHLDSESADVSRAQAVEVAGATHRSAVPVVLVGDFNSDPADHSVRASDPQRTPGSGAYDYLTAEGALTDLALGSPQPAPTYGFGEYVDDDSLGGFTQRIDHIFTRHSGSSTVRPRSVWTTGNRPADRDAVTGLWPSDHAGLVAELDVTGRLS